MEQFVSAVSGPLIESLESRRLLSGVPVGFVSAPPAVVLPNHVVSMAFRVSDSNPADRPEQVKLFGSSTRTLDSSAILLGQSGPVTKSRQTVRVRFSSSSIPTAGKYYLIVQLDAASGGVVSTLAARQPTRFLPANVDLSAQILAQPAGPVVVTPSSNVSSSAVVKLSNGGTVPAVGQITLTIYATTASNLDASAIAVGSVWNSRARIGARQSVIVNVPITLPAGTAFGAYQLFAKVDATTTVADANVTNNISRSPRALVIDNAPSNTDTGGYHHHHFGDGYGLIYIFGDGSFDYIDAGTLDGWDITDPGAIGDSGSSSDTTGSSVDTGGAGSDTGTTSQPSGSDFGGGSDAGSGGSLDSGGSDSSGGSSSSPSSGGDSGGGGDSGSGSDFLVRASVQRPKRR